MRILALETATEACSVALWIDGDVRERFEIAPRRHTELVLPWAEALLADAGIGKSQLDAIACGRGPGAFTGVRLAVALTQGLAFALNRPVLAISTLAALALEANATAGEHVLAAIDARMGEIYLAEYIADARHALHEASPERLLAPGVATRDTGPCLGVGTGFAADGGILATRLATDLLRCDANALPHAAAVAHLAAAAFARGEAIAPDALEPAYLRNKVALTLAEQGKSPGKA